MESVTKAPGAFSLGGHCAPWSPVYGYSQSGNWQSWLARFFDANTTTTAWSGKGLINNSGCKAGPTMADLYPTVRGAAYPDGGAWDFAQSSRPDLVLIFLGTNDYSCGATTDAAFTAALVGFAANVTRFYAASPPSPSGRADTVFMPVVGAMSPTKPLAALTAAVAAINAAGGTAALLDLRNATLDGCGGHPGPFGHWQMAAEAAPQIAAAMGW